MDIGRLIARIIVIGLTLASLGTLSEVTHALYDRAADSQRMLSLGQWNRRLIHGH